VKGLINPVGNQPSEVYWRRRIVLVVAVLVVVLVGWLAIKAVAAAAPGSEPEPAVSTTPQPSVSPEPEETGSAAAMGACTADDLQFTLAAKPNPVPADQQPKIAVTVEHVGTAPCLLDASADSTTLLITSGDDRIWFSRDCPAEAPLIDKEWLLEPGMTREATVAWPRIRSAEGCAAVNSEPGAGTYWAKVKVQGIEAGRTQFLLS